MKFFAVSCFHNSEPFAKCYYRYNKLSLLYMTIVTSNNLEISFLYQNVILNFLTIIIIVFTNIIVYIVYD